jgi:hypothetical protein
MKAIGIKMVDLLPMNAGEALRKGYKIGNNPSETEGYEVTYNEGYKSWTPKNVADSAYFILDEKNDGTKILKEDVDNFITNIDVIKVGDKTTVVNAHSLTGFDTVRHSSCVDPNNYNEGIGYKFAMEKVIDDIWGHLGFVLQWARYGLKSKCDIPPHLQRVINEYKELDIKANKLKEFIINNPMFKKLPEDEQRDLCMQFETMNNYLSILANRLQRAKILINNIDAV